MRFRGFGLPSSEVVFAPGEEYPEKYPTEDTPPIIVPELPSDIPEKTFEEEAAEREVGQTPVKLDQSPPIVPEPPTGSALPWALVGAAAFFLL